MIQYDKWSFQGSKVSLTGRPSVLMTGALNALDWADSSSRTPGGRGFFFRIACGGAGGTPWESGSPPPAGVCVVTPWALTPLH